MTLHRILAGATALALVAAPAFAGAGYVGGRYLTAEVDAIFGGGSVDGWLAEGAFGMNGATWGGQLGGGFGDVESSDFYRFDGHIWWNASPDWRIGAFAAVFDASGTTEWSYGAELSTKLSPNATVWAAGSLGNLDGSGFSTSIDTWSVDFGLNYYPVSSVRLGGYMGFGEADVVFESAFTGGLVIEAQPWDIPLSIVGGWQYFSNDVVLFGETSSNTFTIGLRYSFGSESLQQRNESTPYTGRVAISDRLVDVAPK